jgi:hypothetical protein
MHARNGDAPSASREPPYRAAHLRDKGVAWLLTDILSKSVPNMSGLAIGSSCIPLHFFNRRIRMRICKKRTTRHNHFVCFLNRFVC